MGRITTDLKNSFKRGSIYIQLIYLNVGVFILISFLSVLLMLFNRSMEGALLYLELPASVANFIRQPWSLLTYMFMHSGILHLLFNMLWLYWFGSLFLYFFSAKHLRGIYILGGICGGLLYIVAYNVFPYFSGSIEHSFLLGASASVLAIVVATAYREPDYRVNLLFFGAVRLKYLALFMILSDILLMTSGNAGGHIAHLGGAMAGLGFAMSLKQGTDITAWINFILDGFTSLFQQRNKKRKKKASMNIHYNRSPKDFDYNTRKKAQSEEVDRILDKLKKSGYESLTSEEKKSLFDASKK